MPVDEDRRKYCVYRHTTPGGKVYIGITSQSPQKRFNHGRGYWHNDHFLRAIKKHGWNNIIHEVLENGLNRSDAIATEKRLIKKYDSTNPAKGYNKMTGGDGVGTHTAETIEKLRIINTGKTWTEEQKEKQRQRMLGHKLSAESRKKLSQSKSGENNYFFGRHLTEEHRMKIKQNSPSKKGSKSNLARAVCKYALGGDFICEYPAITTAAEVNGIASPYNITGSINGRQKTCGGYIWRYADREE